MNKYIKYKPLYIKDCPFCGGESTLYQDACNYLVACNKCGIETIWCDTIEQAIEIWNKRFDLETKVEKIEMKNPNNKVYKCLNCGQYMHETSWGSIVNYCTFCGMKIDWSNIKDE